VQPPIMRQIKSVNLSKMNKDFDIMNRKQKGSSKQAVSIPIGDEADEILRGKRIGDWNVEFNNMLLLGVVGFQQEVFAVQNHFTVNVLNEMQRCR
jgi:hypothetical protein